MKTEQEVREQLKETYEHRLSLRVLRKEKNSCKNCEKGSMQTLDLGEFGEYVKYVCMNGYENKCNSCPLFKCKYTREQIEEEMFEDIKDPSICGCKEPKIAALLWVLHKNQEEQIENKPKSVSEENKSTQKSKEGLGHKIMEFLFGK